jgi:hypothetical protein
MGHKHNGNKYLEAVMTIVPAASSLIDTSTMAVTLPRYAQLIRYSECEFFGVNFNTDPTDLCGTIWTKPQRDMVTRYLKEAQEEIEQQTRYFLRPRWLDEGETHAWTFPMKTTWGKVIAGGVKGETTISSGAAVNHAADPAIVGPIATTVTDTGEIHVFHPGTDVEIHPSAISISGGNVTITIPRCRMVTEAASDNPSNGLTYTNLANFESTVDVKRIFNDDSTNALLVWPEGQNCCAGCSETTQTACITVRQGNIGEIGVFAANFSSSVWSRCSAVSCGLCGCSVPDKARLYYYSGMNPTTRQAEDAVIRLAHSKMPQAPCGCDVASRVWQRDREIPKAMTRERANNPFGLSDGAWTAWRFASSLKLIRGSTY